MAVGDAHVFPGFLTAVLTQLSFQSHQLLFSHASAKVRGKNMLEGMFASTDKFLQMTNQLDSKIEICFGNGSKTLWGEKGENGGFQHFLLFPQGFEKASSSFFFFLFPQCFQQATLSGLLKVRIMW